jgi:aminoglycoside 6-adenylyltransferase
MKSKLLSIIKSYARVLHGVDYNTWHDGRFLEEWAENWIVEKLSSCFSHYNKKDTISALLSTMELFRSIAIKVAEKQGFPYPMDADRYTTAWVSTALLN